MWTNNTFLVLKVNKNALCSAWEVHFCVSLWGKKYKMESSDIKLAKEKKAAMMVFDLIEGRRRRENLTQKAMQGILRIGNGQYSNLKKGRSVLSIDQMVRGCEYLGLRVLVIDGRRIMDCGEMYTLSKKGSFPPVSLCKE